MSKDRLTDWHRYFGLILADFFSGSDYQVEIELDLSLKKQLLDVVVIRKGDRLPESPLPDGMQPLASHNLITFKSHHEPLDDYALKELTGHYVNYRKQVSPSMNELLPESDFRLFAVCARSPEKLAKEVTLTRLRNGVYDCPRGTDLIRVLVIAELPEQQPNAMLHLFSASRELVSFGARHYRQHDLQSSTLISRLIGRYCEEGVPMPYTMDDFQREIREELRQEIRQQLLTEQREELIRELSTEERLKDLPPEERLRGLSSDELDQLKRYLDQLRSNPDT